MVLIITKMKVYIAGPLCSEKERKFVEKIERICKKLGFDTYLPHRDCGLVAFKSDIARAFEDDVKALDECNIVVASLNFENIGAGTSWELGYAYAKGKRLIGIRTEEKDSEIDKLSAMLLGSVKMVRNFKELKKVLEGLKAGKRYHRLVNLIFL